MHFRRGFQLARSYLPRQFLHYAFSTVEKNSQNLKILSDSAQKAIWAQHVIRSIITLPLPTSIKDKSLREKIIDLQLQNTGYKLNDENREDVIKMFKEGILIDDKVYDQQRVRNAKETGLSSFGKEKLVFCPNYTTTREIFRYLNDPYKNGLIYGGYGISKTIGIIMFTQLVLFKSKFMMEAKKDSQKKDELDKLTQQNLIDSNKTSKCWYWTISLQQLSELRILRQTEIHIRELLLAQAVQLPKQQLERIRKIQQFQQFKTQLYLNYKRANIPCKVVIDQVDSVAIAMRNWNQIVQQRQERLNKLQQILDNLDINDKLRPQIEQEIEETRFKYNRKLNQLKNTHQLVVFFLKYLDKIKFFGQSLILNFTHNLKLDQLKLQSNLRYPDLLTFNLLGGHKKFNLNYINFQKSLKKQAGKIDFYHFLWFQISRLLESLKVPHEVLEKIKLYYHETIQKRVKIKSYYRFIFIHEILMSKIQNFNHTDPNTSQKQIQAIIDSVTENFDRYCSEKMIKNIQTFAFKQTDNEKQQDNFFYNQNRKREINKQLHRQTKKLVKFNQAFIYLLYKFAQNDVKIGNQSMCYPVKDIQSIMRQQINQILYSKLQNNQFLPFDYNQDEKTIDFLWDPQQFIEIMYRVINPNAKKYFSYFQNDQILELYKINKGSRGSGLQFAFLNTLMPKTQINLKLVQNYEKINPQRLRLDIQIFDTFKYISLTKLSRFFDNMRQILQKSKIYPDKWFCGLPKIKQFLIQGEDHDSRSASIDLMFIRYKKESGIHQIYTVDMTVSKNIKYNQDKFHRLVFQLFQSNIEQEEKHHRLQFNHIILCHESAAQGPREIKLNFPNTISSCLIDNIITIKSSPLEELNVTKCQDATALLGFELLLNWVNKRREIYNNTNNNRPSQQ